MRRVVPVMLAALALGAPLGGVADTASDDLIPKVAEQFVRGLNRRSVALHEKGKYAEAERVIRAALERGQRALGAEHPETLTSLNNLAFLYDAQGRHAEAEPLHRRALAGRERTLGAEHPDTLKSLNNLAALYHAQGRYADAEPLLRRALAACERTLGAEHPQTLTSLNNLAVLYGAQGRYGEAEPLLRRTLAARKRTLGAKHSDTLTSVSNLALLYYSQGRYGEAEPLYRRALAARERTLGAEHPDTQLSIHNLAALYNAQRRYAEAEPLYRRALAASEQTLGAEHPRTLTSLNCLADLYQAQGRYADVEPLYRRLLAASERTLGGEHPSTLIILNNLANVYLGQGRYGEAEPLQRRALATFERTLGAEHPHTLMSLSNLAFLYRGQGRYGEAESLYRRAVAASERVLGAEHPHSIGFQLSLAITLVKTSKLAQAVRRLRAIDDRLRGFVRLQLATTGSEQVRRHRVNAEARLQYIVYTLALAHPDTEALPLAADLLLRWKRLAGEEEAQVARLARTSQDPQVKDLASRLAESRADLTRLVHLQKPDPKAIPESRAELERLEVELATLSRTFADQRAARSLDWKSVRDALPPGSALLELRAYQPFDFKTGEWAAPHWLALLIPADPAAGPPLRLFDLGPTAATAPLLARLSADDPAAEPLLYQSLFGPRDKTIARYPTLFIAPDGALDLVALARLKLPDGRYWIERQSLRTLRTGRDLLAPPPERQGAGRCGIGLAGAHGPRPGRRRPRPDTRRHPRAPRGPRPLSAAGADRPGGAPGRAPLLGRAAHRGPGPDPARRQRAPPEGPGRAAPGAAPRDPRLLPARPGRRPRRRLGPPDGPVRPRAGRRQPGA